MLFNCSNLGYGSVDVVKSYIVHIFGIKLPPFQSKQLYDGDLIKPITNDFCWDAAHNGVRRDVFGDNGTRADDSSVSNSHTSLHNHICTYPYVITYHGARGGGVPGFLVFRWIFAMAVFAVVLKRVSG